jgi:hypothetical protein
MVLVSIKVQNCIEMENKYVMIACHLKHDVQGQDSVFIVRCAQSLELAWRLSSALAIGTN